MIRIKGESKKKDRQADRQMDRWTHRQTDPKQLNFVSNKSLPCFDRHQHGSIANAARIRDEI